MSRKYFENNFSDEYTPYARVLMINPEPRTKGDDLALHDLPVM